MKKIDHRLALAPIAALLAGGLAAQPAQAGEKDLLQRIDQLAHEVESLRDEVRALKAQQAAATTPAAATPVAAAGAEAPATQLTSYGEINVNMPTDSSSDTQLDVRRFIIGFQHRFDPKTKVVTELEVEHAVSSADDAGEVEVEQAFFEREISNDIALRGGLMLMPIGLLNENHEPTAYYGVERNFVETAIIPSTLREAGVQGVFGFGDGFSFQAGVVTGPDMSGWDATSGDGLESPLGSIHQEGQLAAARDPSFFAALNWRGVPGLHLGAGAIGGNATHGADGAPDAGYLLWDVHARWSPGPLQLSALYARGSFSDTADLNRPLVGNPTLFPETFDGALVEAAYRVWRSGDLTLAPFARWEMFNTGRSYADLGAGLTPEAQPTEHVVTTGASLFFGDGLVFKADYQWFDEADNADRLNFGMGWSF
jgi:hypothetical protein